MDSRVCEALSYVDKGLYAETLGEKMELLVNLKTLMSNTRIPYFINAAVLRLLEAFRIDDSALRRFIIQILNECTDELAVVYSKTEITRRLLRFSYSNDSLKRAYNLRLLATLAAVISDSKRVHHLIMKSVDCESRDERAAAVVAMNAFAAASKRFSEMTLRKIEEVINSPQCSLRLKVYVVRVIANLHNDDETIVNAIDICEKILFKTPNKYIAFNIIQSVTSIVQKRRITMPRLMDVLLRYHKASADGRSLRMVILESIKRLSPAADLFSNAVIQLFARLIYAPGVNIDEISLDRSSIWGKNAWTNYLVARTAMRNGHLRSIALPILESIEFSDERFDKLSPYFKAANTENRLWLSALKSICKAAIGEFKVSELENAISNYDHAVCTLEMLCVKKTWWHCFWFCERYVNCLRSTLAVLRRVLVTRNFTSLPLSVGAPSKQWKTCATNMVECYDKWHCLLRECYDADADTITSLDLKCFECSLMCAALMWLVEEDSQLCFDSCLELFASVCTSAVNNYHRELLEWAKGELDRLKNANIPLEKRLSNQIAVMNHVASELLGIARFRLLLKRHLVHGRVVILKHSSSISP
ncbi:unnamed protein product [Anisakis simplex]|uniref:Integrator complex subunit 7 n=1 Tax=Anisakis simplex TaxID=6269 RepID=A0A0M3K5Z3_ANISI|nr:unnamed protein product [Anisakis simplex]